MSKVYLNSNARHSQAPLVGAILTAQAAHRNHRLVRKPSGKVAEYASLIKALASAFVDFKFRGSRARPMANTQTGSEGFTTSAKYLDTR